MNPGTASSTPEPALAAMVEGLGGKDVAWDGEAVSFYTDDGFSVAAELVPGGTRLRVSFDLGAVDSTTVGAWLDRMVPVAPAYLEVVENSDDGQDYVWGTFERPVAGHDWSTDPMLEHAAELWDALDTLRDLAVPDGTQLFGDPVDIAPASAWLLMGDVAAAVTAEETATMVNDARFGMYENTWTSAKQTAVGDLLMVYVTAPDKAVRYVCRAASDAFFSSDIAVNATRTVARQQWWVRTTPTIEVEPISYATLRAARDEHLLLRGRSGHFFTPETIAALSFKAVDPAQQAELDRVAQVPVGLAVLPDPATMTFDQWVSLAAGALPLEKYVSSHLVEPLLRMCLPPAFTTVREFRVGRGSADYVVLEGTDPRCVIEVKLSAVTPKDLEQLRRYTSALGCRGVLMDARRIMLVDAGQVLASTTFARRDMTLQDVAVVGRHLTG